MSKLIVMADPHLVAPPETFRGHDASALLDQGLRHAAARHPDADRLILMGDLTNRGESEAYVALRQLLDGLPWPATLMMGNHDDRAVFSKIFPEHPTDPHGFVQTLTDLTDLRIVTLDSLDPDCTTTEAGRLCPERLAWLETALSEADRPCLVFVHHQPFATGFPAMDGIGLENAADFHAALAQGPVAHVFAGHMHRTITASVSGIAMTVLKSTSRVQTPMQLGRPGFGTPVDEPGAYAIVLTSGSDVVVHFEDFTLTQ